ncbi:MAG: archaellin/type IV pilin N-terminal domain-containing protein [Nanoarchaeota archaeon]
MRKRGFFRFNKKGISPLIATVLLIAFAVALGAVVMNWGRSYVEETARQSGVTSDTKVTCAQKVRLEIVQVGRVPRICYNEDESVIEITLQNKGEVELLGLLFNVLGTEGTGETVDIEETLQRSRIKKYEIEYSESEHGEAEFIQVVPKVQVTGSAVPAECSDSHLQWEEILPCR